MNRAILSVIAAGLVLVATSAAFATPFLDYTEADAGDGLTQYTVFVDTDDGLLLSVFLELSFTGPFNEILSFSTDAPDDNPLFLNDPNYAANQGKDSFFFVEDNFKTGLVGQFFTIDHADANTYNIRAG
jgi:hypothetical protein